MELDTLKQNTTWNDASASINNNFAKVKTALEQGGGGGTVEGAAKYYPIYDPEWQYGFTLSEEKIEANKAAYQAAFAREDAVYYFDMEIKDATVAVTDVLLIGEAVLFRCALVSEKFADDNIISRTERLVTLGSDGVPDVSVQNIDFATKQYVDNIDETKQDILVSGTNIKTIGGESILGEGDIPLPEGGSSIEVDNKLSSISENPVQNKVIYAELIERFEGIDELLDAINGEEI